MIWIFSNVKISPQNAPKVAPDDVIVWLNKAVNAPLYAAHPRQINFRRSPDASYGADVPGAVTLFCFGGGDDCTIPKSTMDKIKSEYDFDYPIEKGKARCPTTGYMVAKYVSHRKRGEPITLVNFGYDVKESTYRCPWHNWMFEAKELALFNHVYTENQPVSDGEKKRVLMRTSGWLGDNIYASAVIENIVRTGKFVINVESNRKKLWENCPWLDRSITALNADVIFRQNYLPPWTNDCPHIIAGTTMDASHKLGCEIPVVAKKPTITMTVPSERLIDGDYIILNAGWQNSAPAKKWSRAYWERLIAMMPDVRFVQMGQSKNHAELLSGAIDMIDKTDLSDLIRLVRDARCVISPPSGVQHIAAALDIPFISIAGGRQPASMDSYPCGVTLSMCGKMDCCKDGGCHMNYFSGEYKTCKNFEIANGDSEPTGKCMLAITPDIVCQEITKIMAQK